MKLETKRNASKTKESTYRRETTREKADPSKANNTLASSQSRSQKTLSGVPQNFNSFRHVITNSTTGDDVSWIVHLRDVKKPVGRPQ